MEPAYLGMGSPAVSSAVPSSQNLQLPQDQFSPSRRRSQPGSAPASPQPSHSQVLPTSPLPHYQQSHYILPQTIPSFGYGHNSFAYLYPTSHPTPPANVRSPSSSRRRNSSQSPDRSSADTGRSWRNSSSNGNWTRGRGKSSGAPRRQQPFNHSQSKHQQQTQYAFRQEGDQYDTIMDYQGRSSRSGYPSTSVPNTPHFSKTMTRPPSQTPSPNRGKGSSPKSISSEPTTKSHRQEAWCREPCRFEIAMLTAKRRMPYSIGTERLPREENAVKEKLSQEEEQTITKQIIELVEDKLQPNADVELRRRLFLEKLERIFNTVWPGHDIQVRAFGSTENKLSSKDSDIDVCIKTPWNGLTSMCQIASEMDKAGMERVICVMAAKVPIVKIWDPELEVQCDMNVNNTGALENTRMIKTYVEIDPRVRPLAMTIKYWTKMRVLNDAAGGGTLSSYTWTCMILNFLQTRDPPILPALHKRLSAPKTTEDGDTISFDDDLSALKGYGENNKETLGGLLYGFFRHYGYEYDWDDSVISVREGKLLPKKASNWYLMQNNRLCVEEPFNTSRNLGNTADDTSIRGLHLELRRACGILEKTQSFDELLAKYEFPDQKPIITSTGTSLRGGRGGYSGRGRQPNAGYTPRQPTSSNKASGNNRRPVNVGQYPNPQMHQAQVMYPEYYYAVPAGPDFHLALLQTQQALAQQQQYRHYQQQHGMATSPSVQDNYQSQLGLQQLINYGAYSSLIGFPPYYYQHQQLQQQQQQQQQQHQQQQQQQHHGAQQMSQSDSQGTASVPASPPVAPALADVRTELRNGIARASRRGLDGYHNTVRSRSQPPIASGGSSYSGPSRPLVLNGQPLPQLNTSVSDDDLDCVELSSNGSTNNIVPTLPETPPDAEVSDEYAGFYRLGGPYQPEVLAAHVADAESFMTPREQIEGRKVYSADVTTPTIDSKKIASHEPHHIPVVLGLEQINDESVRRQIETGPSVSPSTSSTTVTHHSMKERPASPKATNESTTGAPEMQTGVQKVDEQKQKKTPEQSRESSNPVAASGKPAKPSVPAITVPQATPKERKSSKSPKSRSPKANSPKAPSPKQSPSKGKSKKSPQATLWINDDAKTALSPVIEVQTPPLEKSRRKAEEVKEEQAQAQPTPKQEKPQSKANNRAGIVERSVEHQPPPTPAESTKPANNHRHHGHHRHHHNKSTNGSSHKAGGSEATNSTKEDGDKKSTRGAKSHYYKKISNKKKPKPVTGASTAGGDQGGKQPLKDSERKGG